MIKDTILNTLMRRPTRFLYLILHFSLTLGLTVALCAARAPKQSQAQLSPLTTEIFVSLYGSDDGGDGSISNPYRTLKKAGNKASPGDTIYVRGGTYTGVKDNIYGLNGSAAQPITIRPYFNENVIFDGTGADIGRSRSVILFNESSYIIFDGFEVRNSSGRGISTYESHHITISNNRVHKVQSRALSAAGDTIIFEKNEVWRAVLENENEAMAGGGWSAAVSTNERADGSYSTNIIIRNNYIHDCWGEGISPGHAKGVLIEGNTIHDTYSINIYLSASSDVRVNGNYVYATTDTYNRSDHGYPAHGIALANEDVADQKINNVVIANNLIVGTGAGLEYWQDNNTYRDLEIYYNVIKDTHVAAIKFDKTPVNPRRVTVQNNIICAGKNGKTLDIGNPKAWTFKYNNWPDGVPDLDSMAGASHNFSATPGFINPVIGGAASGFKLQANSNIIGAGAAVSAVATDFWGIPRPSKPTIGIYEANTAFDQHIYLPLVQKN